MPGSTPNRHYPYPLGADTINPPRDIRALAEAVDADFSAQVTQTDLTTALAGYLKLSTGGTVAGQVVIDVGGTGPSLSLRNVGDTPYIEFRNHAATLRLGYIQSSVAQQIYNIDNAAGFHLFRVANVEKFRVSPTGGILSGNLTITGTAAVSGALSAASVGVSGDITANDLTLSGHVTATGDVAANDLTLTGNVVANGLMRLGNRAWIGGDGNQLNLIDTVVTTAGTSFDVQLNFYGQGTTTAPGTRAGYIGYASTSEMQIAQQVSGAAMRLSTIGGGDIRLTPGGTLNFEPGGTFQGFMSGPSFIWGKSASDLANAGIEMFGAGSSAEGSIRSTITAAGASMNIYCRHGGTAAVTGQYFIGFYNSSVNAGSINQQGSGVAFNETSDYRLKDVLGEVTDSLARLMELIPRRLAWKADGVEFDGFLAHEVQAVVPRAVTGEKDAVLPDTDEFNPGAIDPQQLDQSKLIPLLVAAVQELAAEVAALKAGA
jgi:hypothetical protein